MPLLDHELVNVIDRVDTRRIVINQISAERAGRTSRGRIFANVHAHKETRMRPRLTYFDRLARERVTSRTATKDLTALEDFIEQSLIHATIAEVSERTHRNQEHCVAGRHSLNRQSLIQIVSRQTQGPRDVCLFLTIINLAANLKLSLGHDHAHRGAVLEFNLDRQHPDAYFMLDATHAITAFRQRHDAF